MRKDTEDESDPVLWRDLPARCPHCSAPIDRDTATKMDHPKCRYCNTPIDGTEIPPERSQVDHTFAPTRITEPCKLATTAMAFGILGLTCTFFFSFAAIPVAMKALRQVRESDGRLTGELRAKFGLLLGCFGVVAYSVILLIIVKSMIKS